MALSMRLVPLLGPDHSWASYQGTKFSCKNRPGIPHHPWQPITKLARHKLQWPLNNTTVLSWKITQHTVPNIDGTKGHKIETRKHPRHGTQCVIQYPTNINPAQSLEENAITVFGPRPNNSLPKYLGDIESVKTEKFKFELDKFLGLHSWWAQNS